LEIQALPTGLQRQDHCATSMVVLEPFDHPVTFLLRHGPDVHQRRIGRQSTSNGFCTENVVSELREDQRTVPLGTEYLETLLQVGHFG